MAFDRRQKSFGEPTRVRADGTRPEARDDDVPRPRPANTAYERYKQELAAFFNGSRPLPEHMKDMLATRPGAAEHGVASDESEAANESATDAAPRGKKRDAQAKGAVDPKKARRVINGPGDDVLALVDAIRKASSPREVEAAVDALRAKGVSMPKDAEVLSKALGHGNEDVLTEAMRGLLEVEMKDIKSPTLLKTRVKNVALLASSSELRELCAKMQARLG
jgi:hypothetical protein